MFKLRRDAKKWRQHKEEQKLKQRQLMLESEYTLKVLVMFLDGKEKVLERTFNGDYIFGLDFINLYPASVVADHYYIEMLNAPITEFPDGEVYLRQSIKGFKRLDVEDNT